MRVGYFSPVHAAAVFSLLYCFKAATYMMELREYGVCYPGGPWGKSHTVGDWSNCRGNYSQSAVQCCPVHSLKLRLGKRDIVHHVHDAEAGAACDLKNSGRMILFLYKHATAAAGAKGTTIFGNRGVSYYVISL